MDFGIWLPGFEPWLSHLLPVGLWWSYLNLQVSVSSSVKGEEQYFVHGVTINMKWTNVYKECTTAPGSLRHYDDYFSDLILAHSTISHTDLRSFSQVHRELMPPVLCPCHLFSQAFPEHSVLLPTHRYFLSQFLSQFCVSIFCLMLFLCVYCFPVYYLTLPTLTEYSLRALFAIVSWHLGQRLAESRHSKIVVKRMRANVIEWSGDQ